MTCLKILRVDPHLNAIFVHHYHTSFCLIVLLYVYHLSKQVFLYQAWVWPVYKVLSLHKRL